MKFAVSAVVCFGIGLVVLRTHPRRFLNQAYFILSSLATIWLWSAHQGVVSSASQLLIPNPSFPWHRANAAVAAFSPWTIWLLRESIVTVGNGKRRTLLRSVPWIGWGGVLMGLCYADSFVFADPDTNLPRRGLAYIIYSILGLTSYIILAILAWQQMRKQTGGRYVETQLVALAMALACLLVVATTSTGNLLDLPAVKNVSFCLLFGGLILAAWAACSERIYSVQQICLSLGQRLALSAVFCITIFTIWRFYETLSPRLFDLFLSITVVTSFVFWLDRKSRRWLDITGDQIVETRRTVIDIALRETIIDKLVPEFSTLLCARNQCQSASLFFSLREIYSASGLDFHKDSPEYPQLCTMGWATPESIERRPMSPASAELSRVMSNQTLGAIVISPRASRNPSLIVALGRKINQQAFTYPEIQRLQATAELMDNILTHSRLTMQAALQARVEHLAMMSRGLAHDLKNLITPISSFLVHSGENLPAEGPAAEVHSAAQRSVRIMTDYVREALFFSDRLSPHFAPVDLSRLFEEVRGITAARAAQRKIALSTQASADLLLTADAVLLQRTLANLVNNAIDASTPEQTVVLSAEAGRAGGVRLKVSDHGCGIPPENLSRIFDPYFTTKEFGDDVRGFGLGLTICQKIVHLHGGTISVTSQSGSGTTILVDLPVDPVATASLSTPSSAAVMKTEPTFYARAVSSA
jgi:signal transduction histidine kinase